MKGAERVLMNNPIRAAFQRWYEAPLLERQGFAFVSSFEERYGGAFIFGVVRLEAVDHP